MIENSENTLAIWKKQISLEIITDLMKGTLCEHIGMQITEIGDDFLKGTLPVDERTQQHMGIIHGGASVVLAETLGSAASNFCCDDAHFIVGLDINANHVRAGKPPLVTGIASPLHIGRKTHVWEIKIIDSEEKLVCVARLTTAVLKKESDE